VPPPVCLAEPFPQKRDFGTALSHPPPPQDQPGFYDLSAVLSTRDSPPPPFVEFFGSPGRLRFRVRSPLTLHSDELLERRVCLVYFLFFSFSLQKIMSEFHS